MSNKNNLAKVYHFDLYGKREEKYEFLNENSLDTIEWNELDAEEPNFFFVKKNFEGAGEYEKGFKIDELFNFSASGMVGGRDAIVISFNNDFAEILNDFKTKQESDLIAKYKLIDSRDWTVKDAISDIKNNKGKIIITNYKAYDYRYTYFTGKSKGFVQYPRQELVQHFNQANIGLALMRNLIPCDNLTQVMVTKSIIDKNFYSFQTSLFPLYLYPETSVQQSTEEEPPRLTASGTPPTEGHRKRKPNLNPAIVQEIAERLGLEFVAEKAFIGASPNASIPLNASSPLMEARGYDIGASPNASTPLNASSPHTEARGLAHVKTFAPIDILDYIYAVLHSPAYREKYKEFLKIDFPRMPYPKAPSPSERAGGEVFWQLVKLGGELRQIHLLESAVVEKPITQYPIGGDNVVTKISFSFPAGEGRDGVVYINETQYFGNVPVVAWNFYIGGYQPAQKWLKDRKGRGLSFEDIQHYQKIIVALTETDRIMKEVDGIIIED